MRRLVVLLAAAGMLLAACGSTGRHLWLTRPVTFSACADSPCGHYAVTLHWASVSGATDYPVLVNGVQKADPTSAPYTLYGLACGTTYTLEVESHGSTTAVIGTTSYTTPSCSGVNGETLISGTASTYSSGTVVYAVSNMNDSTYDEYRCTPPPAYPQVIEGPDLWTYFDQNQSLIDTSNCPHPTNPAGVAAYRQEWATWALSAVY